MASEPHPRPRRVKRLRNEQNTVSGLLSYGSWLVVKDGPWLADAASPFTPGVCPTLPVVWLEQAQVIILLCQFHYLVSELRAVRIVCVIRIGFLQLVMHQLMND